MKANSNASMPNHDQFSSAGRGGAVEPRLNPANDKPMAPEAPAPVAIKQAVTQDLSLPDDDFSYKNKSSGGNKFMKRMGRQMLQPLNNIGSLSGMGMGQAMGKIRF
jgi:hypothetical protein